ncbi:MAG: hypothetical protein LBL75_02050 [Rickettsiales bacterium]|jgi:hypothetical protein|nr:hypothetical protein [Rickettsiales bacterium]
MFSKRLFDILPKDKTLNEVIAEFNARQESRRNIRRDVNKINGFSYAEKTALYNIRLGNDKNNKTTQQSYNTNNSIECVREQMDKIINKDENFVGVFWLDGDNQPTFSKNSNSYKFKTGYGDNNNTIYTDWITENWVSQLQKNINNNYMKDTDWRMCGVISAPADINKTGYAKIVKKPKIGKKSKYGIAMFYMYNIKTNKVERLIPDGQFWLSLGNWDGASCCSLNCLSLATLNASLGYDLWVRVRGLAEQCIKELSSNENAK